MAEISRRGFLEKMFKAGTATALFASVPNLSEASSSRSIILPYVGKVDLYNSILENGNFTWNEVTYNGNRIPSNEEIVRNAIKLAQTMEEVRKHFGNLPITVNSWYRDHASNLAAGGAKNSQHLQGDAVDFTVKGISPYEVHKELERFWGDKGGLGKYHVFTHADVRGYKARWNGS
jgi:uncharacterized protein YcbK (DUF882 family)